MNDQNEQQTTTDPSEQPQGQQTKIWEQWLGYAKEWPQLALAMFKYPRVEIEKIPAQGSWARPLTWVIGSYFLSWLLSLPFTGFYPSSLIVTLIFGTIGLFIASAVLNFILGQIKESPGLYRTAWLIGLLAPIVAAGMLLANLQPYFMLLICFPLLYVYYYFFLIAGKLTQKQGGIFIAVLAFLWLVSAVPAITMQYRFAQHRFIDSMVDLSGGDELDKALIKEAIKAEKAKGK